MITPLFSIRAPWSLPYGTFFIEGSPLSLFFLVLILLLSGLCALYSKEYMASFKHKKSLWAFWIFFSLLVLSMIFVVLARNAILFLIAWEIMALSSFFLVTFEQEEEAASRAGWTYLVATHLGTAFLFVFFILLGNASGSLDFDSFTQLSLSPPTSNLLFLCALIGFGTKAGLIPFHIWLPEAHPAAPSPVSALMSGIMIKIGIYGLLFTLMILGHPPLWWGGLLIALGSLSGIGGVLFALAQHDTKRLLAYSSVENIGIITLGLGLGTIGISAQNLPLSILGFLGALLHTANHCLFKSLLFLSAGAVLHETKTREIDRLGGLLKKMPLTGYTFLIGAMASSGLPLLNGFISEFLIYLGAFKWGIVSQTSITLFSMLTIASLALIGGLAAACFTKVFGTLFLGSPRHSLEKEPHDPSFWMTAPMIVLSGLCFLIGLFPLFFVTSLKNVIATILSPFGISDISILDFWTALTFPLNTITIAAGSFFILVSLLMMLRRFLLSHQKMGSSVTWDCGYAHPTPRMQYTASSFARPLIKPFGFLLSSSSDVFKDKIYASLFYIFEKPLFYLRLFQYGRIQLYIFYILVTLLFLLLWQAGITP